MVFNCSNGFNFFKLFNMREEKWTVISKMEKEEERTEMRQRRNDKWRVKGEMERARDRE